MTPDPELAKLIQRWTPPPPSEDFDRRMLARYRSRHSRRGLWRRFVEARVSIPAPALACALALIGLVVVLLLVRHRAGTTRAPMDGFEPVAQPRLIVERLEGPR